jgi:hypothetical protein
LTEEPKEMTQCATAALFRAAWERPSKTPMRNEHPDLNIQPCNKTKQCGQL